MNQTVASQYCSPLAAAELADWNHAARQSTCHPQSKSPGDVLGESLLKLKQGLHQVSDETEPQQTSDVAVLTESAATERRLYPRCPTFGQVSIAPWPAGADYHSQVAEALLRESGIAGELLNLSQNGLAITVLHQFVATEMLVARLISAERGLHYDTLCRVVRCKPIGDGRWQIVARFPLEIPFHVAYQLSDHDPQLTGASLE